MKQSRSLSLADEDEHVASALSSCHRILNVYIAQLRDMTRNRHKHPFSGLMSYISWDALTL